MFAHWKRMRYLLTYLGQLRLPFFLACCRLWQWKSHGNYRTGASRPGAIATGSWTFSRTTTPGSRPSSRTTTPGSRTSSRTITLGSRTSFGTISPGSRSSSGTISTTSCCCRSSSTISSYGHAQNPKAFSTFPTDGWGDGWRTGRRDGWKGRRMRRTTSQGRQNHRYYIVR